MQQINNPFGIAYAHYDVADNTVDKKWSEFDCSALKHLSFGMLC